MSTTLGASTVVGLLALFVALLVGTSLAEDNPGVIGIEPNPSLTPETTAGPSCVTSP